MIHHVKDKILPSLRNHFVSLYLRKHGERFAEDVAIKPRLVLRTLREMSISIMPAAQALADDFRKTYGTSGIIARIVSVMAKRAKAV